MKEGEHNRFVELQIAVSVAFNTHRENASAGNLAALREAVHELFCHPRFRRKVEFMISHQLSAYHHGQTSLKPVADEVIGYLMVRLFHAPHTDRRMEIMRFNPALSNFVT